jgi:glutamate dehydrogenase
VERFGLFAVGDLEELTGAPVAEVVQALLIAEHLLGAEPLALALWHRDTPLEATVRTQADLHRSLVDFAEELLRLCPVADLSLDWMRAQRPHFARFGRRVEREGRAGDGAFARRMAQARAAELSEARAAEAAALPVLSRCGVALHAAARMGTPLPRALAANRAVFALLPFLAAEAQLRGPAWEAEEMTHQLRVEWLHRLAGMRERAVERLLAAPAREPLAAGRRLWHAHPGWDALAGLTRQMAEAPEADPMRTVLLLTRLETLIDATAALPPPS